MLFPKTHGIRLYDTNKNHLFTIINCMHGEIWMERNCYDLVNAMTGNIVMCRLTEMFVEELIKLYPISCLAISDNRDDEDE